ncbi:MAG: NADPH:quinone reductase [Nocardiopsaceae bacterium]|jgi:NADPH2:quinone reductase|nr:NADPH:quinone reductase [Nocardiopsaceae bacterium]
MRAALYDRYGAAGEVLRVEEVATPEPGPGEVRVKITCSGVNPTDWKSRGGSTPRPIDGFQIPHHDGCGVIDAVGESVDPGRIGQRVWTWLAAAGRRWGTAAEWTVVPAEQAVPLPDGVSFELGASLGVPAMTAHRCLFADGPVEGKTILVAGGAGAVGHFAIELAKFHGARVVTTVSGPEKADLAKNAGADLVVNYRDPSAAEEIKAFGPVDRIIEVALGANFELDLAVLKPLGEIITYAAEPSDPTLAVRACMNANLIMRFVLLYGVPRGALAHAARDITAALTGGALTELPVHRFSLDEIVAAQDAVQNGAVGKVLIAPA